MTTHQPHTYKAIARTAATLAVAASAAASAFAAPTASAAPNLDSGGLFDMLNRIHMNAGCKSYIQTPVFNKAVGEVAYGFSHPNDPVTIAGGPHVSGDRALENNGYVPRVWGEADYVNNSGNATPQDAVNFWMANNTKEIFPKCDSENLGTAISAANGKWVAVALVASQNNSPAPGPQPGQNVPIK